MLDLTAGTKKFLPIKLPSGVTVNVLMPKKKLMDAMMDMEEDLKTKNTPMDLIDRIVEMVSRILSNNVSGTEITPSEVEDQLDFSDMAAVFRAYQDFALEAVNDPN